MKSDPDKQSELDLPVLDQVIDPDSDRARLITALDELSHLIDRVPKPGEAMSEADYEALKQDLNARLVEMFDEMAERMKYIIPKMVDETLRAHLENKKNER